MKRIIETRRWFILLWRKAKFLHSREPILVSEALAVRFSWLKRYHGSLECCLLRGIDGTDELQLTCPLGKRKVYGRRLQQQGAPTTSVQTENRMSKSMLRVSHHLNTLAKIANTSVTQTKTDLSFFGVTCSLSKNALISMRWFLCSDSGAQRAIQDS